ncbi:hypothetical protein [Clostridium kluyveri]|uniref:Uncharacterized protein n=2 Tax=Clostridium kluyveri TaxID=1534 RepID=A5N1J1_CLOK5|nr:hypothetical protein [Clostridium kluyveri]EDK34987.1 Hypothetical protein CKL_2979 [Clostridium kluyveri DSM 555]
MLKMKYKIISAVMLATPLLLNTGIGTTVSACSANNKPGVVYKSKYKAPAKPVKKVVNKHKVKAPYAKPAPKVVHSVPNAYR